MWRAGGPDRPVASFVAEDAAEDRRAVEAGEAQPVDRPVPAHQRSAVPIRKEPIVGYRGRAHVSSSARTSAGSASGSFGEARGPVHAVGVRAVSRAGSAYLTPKDQGREAVLLGVSSRSHRATVPGHHPDG